MISKAGIVIVLTLKARMVRLEIIKSQWASKISDPASKLSGMDSVFSTPPLL